MNSQDILNQDNFLIFMAVIVFILTLTLAGCIVLLVSFSRLKKKYSRFMSGFYEDKSIEDVLDTAVSQITYQEKKTIEIGKRLAVLENNIRFSIQKAGIVRYKAFENAGGDQSFSIALLDAENNGFVITSIYNDGLSSVYGKEVKNGRSDHRISEEEQKALDKAMSFSSENALKQSAQKG